MKYVDQREWYDKSIIVFYKESNVYTFVSRSDQLELVRKGHGLFFMMKQEEEMKVEYSFDMKYKQVIMYV